MICDRDTDNAPALAPRLATPLLPGSDISAKARANESTSAIGGVFISLVGDRVGICE